MVNGELLIIWWTDGPDVIKFILFHIQGLEIIEFMTITQLVLKGW